jgi:hypothetical protein
MMFKQWLLTRYKCLRRSSTIFSSTFLCFSDAALLEMKAQALIQAKYLIYLVFTVQTHIAAVHEQVFSICDKIF